MTFLKSGLFYQDYSELSNLDFAARNKKYQQFLINKMQNVNPKYFLLVILLFCGASHEKAIKPIEELEVCERAIWR